MTGRPLITANAAPDGGGVPRPAGTERLSVPFPDEADTRLGLSPREYEIVRQVAHDHSNKEIAAILGISEWTVSTHLRRIFAKLDVHTRAAMVARVAHPT